MIVLRFEVVKLVERFARPDKDGTRWTTYNSIGLQEIENCALVPSVEGESSNVTANSPVPLVLGGAM